MEPLLTWAFSSVDKGVEWIDVVLGSILAARKKKVVVPVAGIQM